MNEALRAAIAQDNGVAVEYKGFQATLHPPTGLQAMEYIRDAKALMPSNAAQEFLSERDKGNEEPASEAVQADLDEVEAKSMDFVAKWVNVLFAPEGVTPVEAWRAFQALGGMTGPVPGVMMDMVKDCLGVPEERLEAVPS